MTDHRQAIRRQLETSAETLRQTAASCAESIAQGAAMMVSTLRAGHKILLCGNGGSAADCQHIAAELVSALNHDKPRRALPAIALTTDTSFLTANANDFGFEQVFARQVEALGQAGDLLIAISTSGNSANVLRALQQARASGLQSILLSGESGGKARTEATLAILVPSRSTQQIQEAHIAIGHTCCELVEQELFPG